jgi:alanine dehydrogenase
MRIGIPKEIKNHECRVGATPEMVDLLVRAGHEVWVETHAGHRIGFTDELYEKAGARIVRTAEEAWSPEMVIKVKEPLSVEFPYMHEGQVLFTYLHLAADRKLVDELLKRKVVGIAYETVTDDRGGLPLLLPMSEVAGRIAIQAGAQALHMANGGKGILLGGVPGVPPARVVVIGGGVSGTEAARMALGLGADVTVIDRSQPRLRQLSDLFQSRVKTRYSTAQAIEEEVARADLVVGAVLIPGAAAPKLVTRKMVSMMTPGSVIVDIAIDQGGCCETSRPTTHSDPTYVEEGVVHYCVTNMPGACARTATRALTIATMPFALELANLGYRKAIGANAHLRNGLNVCLGAVTNPEVAEEFGYVRAPYENYLER